MGSELREYLRIQLDEGRSFSILAHHRGCVQGMSGVRFLHSSDFGGFAISREHGVARCSVLIVVLSLLMQSVAGALRARPFVVGSVPVDLGACAGNARADDNLKRFPITCNLAGSTVEATLLVSSLCRSFTFTLSSL